jgi:hypothetical protein
MDPEVAVCNMQRLFRGFRARRQTEREREEELVFIGMKPKPKSHASGPDAMSSEEIDRELELAYRRRKTEQAENKEAYERALVDLKEEVRREEGPGMREALREERHLWITDHIAETKEIPEDLTGYYMVRRPRPVVALLTAATSRRNTPMQRRRPSRSPRRRGARRARKAARRTRRARTRRAARRIRRVARKGRAKWSRKSPRRPRPCKAKEKIPLACTSGWYTTKTSGGAATRTITPRRSTTKTLPRRGCALTWRSS